jgi:hypothetical protein
MCDGRGAGCAEGVIDPLIAACHARTRCDPNLATYMRVHVRRR